MSRRWRLMKWSFSRFARCAGAPLSARSEASRLRRLADAETWHHEPRPRMSGCEGGVVSSCGWSRLGRLLSRVTLMSGDLSLEGVFAAMRPRGSVGAGLVDRGWLDQKPVRPWA